MKVITLVSVQVISGSLLTITCKFMYKQEQDNILFNQVFLLSMISFLGQTFNLLLFKLKNASSSSSYQILSEHSSSQVLLQLFTPALLHMSCQITGFAAYKHINASLSMMIGSTLPLMTAILSKAILKTQIEQHQKHGIIVIMFGSLIINLYTYLFNNTTNHTNLWGIFLSNFSTFLFACLIISEEISLKQYQLDSSLIAGCEGLFSLLISFILLPFVNHYMESVDVKLFLNFFFNNSNFFLGVFSLILSDMIYTLCCLLVTQHLSAMKRSIIYQLRITSVWIITLFLKDPEYLGSQPWEVFSFIQLFGYILLVLGVFIFNQIIAFPKQPLLLYKPNLSLISLQSTNHQQQPQIN